MQSRVYACMLSSFALSSRDKHPEQKQLGEERIYSFTTVCHSGKPWQEHNQRLKKKPQRAAAAESITVVFPGGPTSLGHDYTISKGHRRGAQPGAWPLLLSTITHRFTGNRVYQVLAASEH